MAPGQIVVDEESGCAPALNPCVVKPSNGSEGIRTAALSTRRMQRQGTLAFTSLSVEIRFRLHQGGTMKKLRLSVVMVAVFASGFWPDARKPPRSHLMFPTVFANRSIKQASKTSPSVRIATRRSEEHTSELQSLR